MFIIFSDNNDSYVLLWFEFSCKPFSTRRRHAVKFNDAFIASIATLCIPIGSDSDNEFGDYDANCNGYRVHSIVINK